LHALACNDWPALSTVCEDYQGDVDKIVVQLIAVNTSKRERDALVDRIDALAREYPGRGVTLGPEAASVMAEVEASSVGRLNLVITRLVTRIAELEKEKRPSQDLAFYLSTWTDEDDDEAPDGCRCDRRLSPTHRCDGDIIRCNKRAAYLKSEGLLPFDSVRIPDAD